MNIKQELKKSETIVGLVHDFKKIINKRKNISKINTQEKFINNYFELFKLKKLQLGTGRNTLEGWLNSDLSPRSNQSIQLDVTKKFPFENNTFDYIYTEHMIEHLSWDEGWFKLQECQRILKPGGRIRIATPDLNVLLNLYKSNENGVNENYIKWITDRCLPDVGAYKSAFVINNAFRNWGHQFLYDEDLLSMLMRTCGFKNIEVFAYGESNDDNFRNIENHGNAIGDRDMAIYETMILEGEC